MRLDKSPRLLQLFAHLVVSPSRCPSPARLPRLLRDKQEHPGLWLLSWWPRPGRLVQFPSSQEQGALGRPPWLLLAICLLSQLVRELLGWGVQGDPLVSPQPGPSLQFLPGPARPVNAPVALVTLVGVKPRSELLRRQRQHQGPLRVFPEGPEPPGAFMLRHAHANNRLRAPRRAVPGQALTGRPCFLPLLRSPHVVFLSQSTLTGASQLGGTRLCHEIAHAWFGLAIGARDWTEEWLSEGFATHLEDVFWARARQVGFCP